MNSSYSLTGHFIRYTLLVPGWTTFAFTTALILRGIDSTRCCKHSSEILVHIVMIASHSCCRFVVCTSMMRISRSTTSQRCSIGLRSGDCGGHLSKVNSLSCSRNQSEMIWALWHGALSCWKYIRRWVHCSHKGMDIVNNTQVDCGVKQCSIGTKGPKVCQENTPHTPLHHHQQPKPLRQGRTDPCFHVLYCKFWRYHLNVAAAIETHQTRQRFFNLLLSDFGDPVGIVSSVSCSYLTGASPGVVFCCWSSSASGFDVLCVQRWYSAYIGCNEWLFELLLPFYQL